MNGSSNQRASRSGLPLAWLLAIYLLLLAIVLVGGTALGAPATGAELTVSSVWASFWEADDDGWAFWKWYHLRFRPLLFAGLAGAVLALAGTIFQAALRNPLAEPYILGVSGGASVGVFAMLTLQGWFGFSLGTEIFGGYWEFGNGLGAFAGALGAILLLLTLARWARLFDPASLILCGAILNAIFGALILLFYSLAEQHSVKSSLLWLMGNTGVEVTLGQPAIRMCAIALLVGGTGFFLVSRWFDVLSLGEDEAADLGIDPRRLRIVSLIAASLLTGAVVAVAGPIGFIGLVVPHTLRHIHGASHRRLIPLSMVGGAIFLMLADLLARNALRPALIPVGAITALIGGPFFLSLLVLQRRRGGTDG
ncbi:MAG: iron ABC transporter permease [Planctomycetota bacterium]